MTDDKKKEFNHPAYINVPYFVLQDSRLDFFNKFLFAFFWSFSVSGKRIKASNEYLATLFRVSDKHIQARIKELEDLGFIKRAMIRYKRVIEVLYVPYDDIEIESQRPNLKLLPTTVGASTKTELPPTTVGTSHQPQLVPAPTIVGTDIKEDNKEDIKAINNTSRVNAKEVKEANAEVERLFEKFYAVYPRKRDRQAALKAFKKLKPNEEFVSTLVEDVNKRLSTEWKDKELQFIPYPATYLNGKRWTDAIETTIAQPVKPRYPTPDERAANEQKIREREYQAQKAKEAEIAASRDFKNRISNHIGAAEMMKRQEEHRKELGLSVREYHEQVVLKNQGRVQEDIV